ncbi:MAG: PDZ domain-containing protein [Desulfatitalea sp.]|nr:PDZ domain-containing protein [Desulfatitalea sp.]
MEEKSYALRIDELKIGDIVLKNIPSISHSAKNDHVLIGNKFLEKFLVLLDYPAGEMILTPYAIPFETNIPTYGIAFVKKDQKTMVSGVWNNSSAARNGLQPGDEVTKVNTMETSALSLMKIMALSLAKDKDTLTLELIKDKRFQEVILHKEMLLPDLN